MADPVRHILGNFDTALQALRRDMLLMGTLAERNLQNAMTGLIGEGDDLCNRVIADDDEIDQLEVGIDRAGVDILIRFQPLATDLRQVVATMRVSSNLERVGDEAVNIARKARKLTSGTTAKDREILEPIGQKALALLRNSLQAIEKNDLALAQSLPPQDKEIDALVTDAAAYLTHRMSSDAEHLQDSIALLFVTRHLERIGDHAKNIAEEAVYAAAAEDIRHAKRR
jgi:phosphate transport system protein